MLRNKLQNNKKAMMVLCTLAWSGSAIALNAPDPLLSMGDNSMTNPAQFDKAQIADEDFVFDPTHQSFDWDTFFAEKAPHLLDQQQAFTHWVGFHSINPTLVLALMEMESGVISNAKGQNIDRPLARLSEKTTFSEQLNDVLARLNQRFYAVRQQQQTEIKANGALKLRQTAGTQALNHLFHSGKTLPGNKLAKSLNQANVAQLVKIHDNLFADQGISFAPVTEDSVTAIASAVAVNTLLPNITLQLPWSKGYSWAGGGSHGYDGSSGPQSSLDFAYDWPAWGGQTWSVRSAHSGTVTVLSSCQVRVTNSSGWATNYYHLSNVGLSNGQYINANTHLGYYANNKSQALCQGGQSTGPHVHFSLLKNGIYQSLDNVTLSHYKVNTGRWHYDDNCSYFYYNNLQTGGYKCAWSMMAND